jgi:hypothetical protein
MKQKIPKGLLNQTEFARKHNISKQRVNQIIKDGELVTKMVYNRLYVCDNKFNSDRIRELCCGKGNYNHISYNY